MALGEFLRDQLSVGRRYHDAAPTSTLLVKHSGVQYRTKGEMVSEAGVSRKRAGRWRWSWRLRLGTVRGLEGVPRLPLLTHWRECKVFDAVKAGRRRLQAVCQGDMRYALTAVVTMRRDVLMNAEV